MDWDRIEGKQLKRRVKEKWGKLTDDDLTFINGRRERPGDASHDPPELSRLVGPTLA
jgi:uncharacterized protein YjbJ (UPF0337 family)